MVANLGTFEWGIIAAELLLMAKEGFFPAQSIQAGMFIKIRAGVQSSSRPAHLSCCCHSQDWASPSHFQLLCWSPGM